MKTNAWFGCLVVGICLLFAGNPAVAGLKDIQVEKLPQDTGVRRIYAELQSVEAMVQTWSSEWKYNTPKEKVALLLKKSLAELQKAQATAPDNRELLLLTGLVAHYAYNVDVEEAYNVAVSALKKVSTEAPDDYRAEWFLGILQCQTMDAGAGMERFLSIEKRLPWEKLSPGFWNDYVYCASVNNMPAHLLRAGARAAKLGGGAPFEYAFLVDMARKRFDETDAATEYPRKDVWWTNDQGSRVVFTNTMFGFSFYSPGSWRLTLSDVKNGVCQVRIQMGPFPGKVGNVTPNIVIVVRPVKEGESPEDLSKTLVSGGLSPAGKAASCPVSECSRFTAAKPDFYKQEGDGYAYATIFQSEAPEFPGLIFESSEPPPKTGKEGLKFYRLNQRKLRLKGKLTYIVFLDTADSVRQEAEKSYEEFLRNMQVE